MYLTNEWYIYIRDVILHVFYLCVRDLNTLKGYFNHKEATDGCIDDFIPIVNESDEWFLKWKKDTIKF